MSGDGAGLTPGRARAGRLWKCRSGQLRVAATGRLLAFVAVPGEEHPRRQSGYPCAPPLGAHRAIDNPVEGENGVVRYVGPWRLERWDGQQWAVVAVTNVSEERDAFVLSGPNWDPPPRHLRSGYGIRYGPADDG
jgi:hypothetical protein